MRSGNTTAIIVAAISAFVAAAVFIVGEVLRYYRDRKERRRQLVVRMLDTIDQIVHRQMLPPLMRGWRSDEVDLLMTAQRLLVELRKRDLVVGKWAGAQTQRLARTTDKSKYLERVLRIESKLIGWHRGDIKLRWFAEDLKREPLLEDFRVPPLVGWKRSAGDVGENVRLIGGAVAVLVVLKRILTR
ncbi:hypothetical protein [Specibacter cremeus]|uniref:hypothetical protein n=1 Tax=Specibacter cremeus TaxID=1629051 RepID=UPI000F775593|nr:hypothetical protein [Specibacter cremeus]